MKKYIYILSVLLIVGSVLVAGEWFKTVQSAKTYAKSATTIDTSAAIDISGKESVELAFGIYGNDSVRTMIYVDGNVGGKWVNFVTDSLKLVDATTNFGRTVLLRGYGTNKIPGVNSIKVIISNQAGDDSTSTMYYNLYLRGR